MLATITNAHASLTRRANAVRCLPGGAARA